MSATIDFSGALRRWWWVIVFLLAAALAATAFITARQRPVFASSAMLVVAPSTEAHDTSDFVRGLDTLERRTVVATFARIASTLEVREAVAKELDVSTMVLRGYRVTGSVVPNTNIIRIDTEGPDAEMAARIANAAAEITAREARSLYRVFSMRLLARATPRRRPTYPDPQRNYLAGGTVGLFLGIAAALVLDRGRATNAPRTEET